jgi:hypothetical protein
MFTINKREIDFGTNIGYRDFRHITIKCFQPRQQLLVDMGSESFQHSFGRNATKREMLRPLVTSLEGPAVHGNYAATFWIEKVRDKAAPKIGADFEIEIPGGQASGKPLYS